MLSELRGAHRQRQFLIAARRLLSERGEANSLGLARELIARLAGLEPASLENVFDRLARDFNPDPAAVLAAAQAYAEAPDAERLLALIRASEPPRQELFRRLNRAPGATGTLVRLRRALLSGLARHPEWRSVESDLLHLFSSWFNPGFLQMRQVDWNSPAQLLEQIIRHEAVHEIDGWDDLRRRLQPDRRLFAFFHPQLPEEPLIFVEVALLPEMPGAIAPLIDKKAETMPLDKYKVAVFYSISNCEPGLKGVSLGNFLIKRVAEHLQREIPKLRSFCTLSPIPGFAAWLAKGRLDDLPGLKKPQLERARAARELLERTCGGEWARLSQAEPLSQLDEEAQQALLRLAAVYLVAQSATPQGDPVARFHLDNGARLERLNPLGNRSAKGLKQSCGMMVNYLYDLGKIEGHHEAFTQGEIAYSRGVAALL
ncbi:malonyl-CoA decarboxylase [Roseateles violae]|uniref:Malonyl-CoA decarboxylase n=1 Tax=Roseateles violae TaxID=3058042 RepID=A0ABT8DW14_9BURK|nr:malonyl-CoA decarboxylase [Pelomonas sp. PFR6]MDN3922496.1 malonyl-CoA decarboxylase [Pelomonas sp. PFR6]